jgi:hypothetical protein
LARFTNRLREWHQFGDWHIATRNRDLLARFNGGKKTRQMGFGFVNFYRLHGGNLC